MYKKINKRTKKKINNTKWFNHETIGIALVLSHIVVMITFVLIFALDITMLYILYVLNIVSKLENKNKCLNTI